MKKVTGLGGIFFKTGDHERTRPGIGNTSASNRRAGAGCSSGARTPTPSSAATPRGALIKQDSDKFEPSKLPFMVNDQVADLVGLLVEMRAAGVEIVGEMEQHENGKFAWIMDPDGRNIELWEPVPSPEDPYLS